MWIIGLMNLKEKKNATKDLFHEVNFSIDYFNHNFFKKLTDLKNNCRVLLYQVLLFLPLAQFVNKNKHVQNIQVMKTVVVLHKLYNSIERNVLFERNCNCFVGLK